jgi:hypothetical protein
VYKETSVEDLQVGDQVELLTKVRRQVVKLTAIVPRANGIKFLSRNADGAVVSFGRYGQTMHRPIV